MSEVAHVEVAASGAPLEIVNDAPVEKSPVELMHEVASELGWSPIEKWKGSPDDWRDAPDFLKRTPQMVKSLKKQMEASNRIAADRMEKVREQAIKDADERIAAAVENGDVDQANRAIADRDRAAQKPDPLVEAFASENAWFMTDDLARNLAIATADKIAKSGGTVAAQLEAAKAEVEKRFPEYRDGDEPEAKTSKAPPSVQGGQRTAAPAAREKGWSDLPKHIQGSASPKFLKSMGLSQEEYAKSWFKEYS